LVGVTEVIVGLGVRANEGAATAQSASRVRKEVARRRRMRRKIDQTPDGFRDGKRIEG
jgi:hypothetical protein